MQWTTVQGQRYDSSPPAAYAVFAANGQITAVKVQQRRAKQLLLGRIQCTLAQPDRQRTLPTLLYAGSIQRLAGCACSKAVQRVAGQDVRLPAGNFGFVKSQNQRFLSMPSPE